MVNQYFNRQFLLTRKPFDILGWNHINVSEFHLYTHPNLEVTKVSDGKVELFLLGFFFDYRHPERTNADILNVLLSYGTFDELLEASNEFSGRFVCIYRSVIDLKIFHDACGQREVFYDSTFSVFGSQPKLIEKVIPGEILTDEVAIDYFHSEVFTREKLFVGANTHRANIMRLMPNHYVDIRKRGVFRFFPVTHVGSRKLDAVAEEAVTRLRGFLKAASLRYPLELGVTAGYDSRILFLASVDLDLKRYVEIRNQPDNHIDIQYASRLGEMYHRIVEIRDRSSEDNAENEEVHTASIDFPKGRGVRMSDSDVMIINGHASEIAKNYFTLRPLVGASQSVTGADLARMYYYKDSVYAARQYDAWLSENKILFDRTGYAYLDLFYWEERMGNWAAKLKSKAALSSEIYSPFCSRGLLSMLLSVNKRDRDKYHSKLHDTMIMKMSARGLDLPINPGKYKQKILILRKLGLYKFDQKYGLISKILRHLPF